MATRDRVHLTITLITLVALICTTALGGVTWLVALLWVLWLVGAVVSTGVARAWRRREREG
ncbi:hypothetical protein KIK06_17955 [Nocardiopsis sp. EMB25]|uniref:hypothetical protein n=1 Tax=Nocardiopsis TaxID=2013 RepID=UPI0003487E11|nr:MULTISPECIES: hypothetical protein [Nocardiopsis]MCY9785775.1 hypothetical protein [Nocardiopsis sp. EMB25]